jgi:hypothetical protein
MSVSKNQYLKEEWSDGLEEKKEKHKGTTENESYSLWKENNVLRN